MVVASRFSGFVWYTRTILVCDMQTSPNALTSAQEKTLTAHLYTVLTDLKDPQTLQTFVEDFFTPTEQSVFAKRLQVAWLLHQGLSYEAIKDKLHVSSATISSVAAIKDKPGLQKAFELLQVDTWADQMASRVMRWFHKPTSR